ncbi:MAG TPA: hypothetical protein VNU44_09630 [Bryobacteraceae bacterium]|jgi:hypothetical protein|nr:hypothetical protein [Bryobacteraceae bacterium]
MAEATQIMFSHKELVEMMIKKQELHEGIWALSVRFGMQATSFGTSQDGSDVLPTALIPVVEIGINRAEKENNISVDASRVNPKKPTVPGMTFKRRPRH